MRKRQQLDLEGEIKTKQIAKSVKASQFYKPFITKRIFMYIFKTLVGLASWIIRIKAQVLEVYHNGPKIKIEQH
jgi:hypothetical protein